LRNTTRTPIAQKTQTTPASIAPCVPSRRSVTSSNTTGTNVPSMMRGAAWRRIVRRSGMSKCTAFT
jgi:hypothetical protein